ncbi:beta-lactamase family protein [bacterium]|nr:beta-lactamase family protein [bacterium]
MVLALGLLATTPVLGQVKRPTIKPRPVPQITTAARFPALDRSMKSEFIKLDKQGAGGVSGMSVAVMKNGRIVYTKGFGYLNKQDNVAMSAQTPLPWASVSKVLTAVAAWQLINHPQGNLTPDTKVADVVSYWAPQGSTHQEKKKLVTVGNLMNHRAGIGGYSSSGARDISGSEWQAAYDQATSRVRRLGPKPEWDPRASLSYYTTKPLSGGIRTLQGEQKWNYEYTSFGTSVLGAVVDQKARQVSGGRKGYVDWVKQDIGEAVGMKSLKTSNISRQKIPGGGWDSPVTDMAKFMQALANDQLVPMNQLSSAMSLSRGGSYGRGVRRTENPSGSSRWYVGHGGVQTGVRTAMFILTTYNSRTGMVTVAPEKFGVCVMANYGGARRRNADGDILIEQDPYVNLMPIIESAYQATR